MQFVANVATGLWIWRILILPGHRLALQIVSSLQRCWALRENRTVR